MPEANASDFPSRYDPKPVEAKWYEFWEKSGFFTANAQSPKPKYSIVIPPPNVTGSLHMGHALDNGLPDILIRHKKMQGFETLWLPGMDHAGIGTQVKVERMLAKEGKTRFDLGREGFLERAWEWKEKYGGEIIVQLRRLGCCLDWTRLRFTMDEGLSRAVREAFVRYYEKGLIYRGLRIVNWCSRCGTAVSDLEVKFKEENAHLWYVRYPIADDGSRRDRENERSRDQEADTRSLDPSIPGSLSYLVVATTRPETMLGDTAVAVNPADERFKAFVGKMLELPLTGRKIPVIADAAVEMEFGTGAVKVTPAHDPVDFEIGERHKLERIKVIGDDARMTDAVPPKYRGMTREECRKAVVVDLEAQGLMEKIENYRHSVGTCDRCETVIEPLASMQWWVKMKPLAEPAIRVVEEGKVKFHPERWTKVYLEWMKNIRDWCISRQLWWGHRIPVWYCDCGEVIVARRDPTECPKCHSKNLRQDEDVLDTWFSSALWPFSVMGWPDEQAADYRKFYPTDFLTTDPDIIFRWEARMIFSALEFTGRVPFDDVYIHSTVLDKSGARMSRSKGIGVDPLEIFDIYGTDAARFTICYLESQSQSYRLWNERFELGRNFCNKIWNACRLVAPAIAGSDQRPVTSDQLRPVDHWIRGRFNGVLARVNDGLARYTFSQVASALYDFFWHDLCDWYLEFSKTRLKAEDAAVRQTLFDVFRGSLQLLHPIMPFITEELWSRLGYGRDQGIKGSRDQVPGTGVHSILESVWPEALALDESETARVETMRELIVAVRNIRAEMEVPAKTAVKCIVNSADAGLVDFLRRSEGLIGELAKVSALEFGTTRPEKSSIAALSACEAYVPLAGVVDVEKELDRMRKEIANLEKLIAGIDAKFSNANFAARAKPEVVEGERERRAEFSSKLDRLRRQLDAWE
ncbi:MAG: valine--tRNA ligase [candidate division WOR-3 bacterium]|nr:valine--tRNA ligase [candidate division WOR-3 bacterium]